MNVRHFATRTIFMKHRRTKSHKCFTFKTRPHDETFVRFWLALFSNVSRCITNVSRCITNVSRCITNVSRCITNGSRCITNVRCCITKILWQKSHKNLIEWTGLDICVFTLDARHIRESDANVACICRARSAQQVMLLLDPSVS
jgi:hypothetical protein